VVAHWPVQTVAISSYCLQIVTTIPLGQKNELDDEIRARRSVAGNHRNSGKRGRLGRSAGSAHNCWDLVVPAGIIPQGCHNSTGGTVGGQIGYRWQSTNWVFGLEGQGNWADFSGSNATPVGGNPFGGLNDRSRIDSFGLITGQVGYAWNNVLVYVKGGAAVVSDKYDALDPAAGGAAFGSASDTRWGETVGAGLEVGFAQNWSIGAEYNHIFLDSHDVTLTSAGFVAGTVRTSQDVDMGLIRLNYRWGGPVVAKY